MTARGLTEGQYEQLRKDPVFLFREALVSEAAFLKYTQEAERLEEAQGDFSMSMDALDQFVQVRPHAHGWLRNVAFLPITAAGGGRVVVWSQDIPGRPSSSLKMRAGQGHLALDAAIAAGLLPRHRAVRRPLPSPLNLSSPPRDRSLSGAGLRPLS